jgi:hypothetical protein
MLDYKGYTDQIEAMAEDQLREHVLELTIEEARLYLVEGELARKHGSLHYGDERMQVRQQHHEVKFKLREASLELYERWRRQQA